MDFSSLTGGGSLDAGSGVNDGYTLNTLGARFGNNTITQAAFNVPWWAWVLFALVLAYAAYLAWGK